MTQGEGRCLLWGAPRGPQHSVWTGLAGPPGPVKGGAGFPQGIPRPATGCPLGGQGLGVLAEPAGTPRPHPEGSTDLFLLGASL